MDTVKRAVAVPVALEGEQWRTSQREASTGYEHNESVRRWSAIIAAIIDYQNRHSGASPPDHTLAANTKLSLGQVRYHLRQMEDRGLIKDNPGFPRRLVVLNVAKQLDPAAMQRVAQRNSTMGEAMGKVIDRLKVEATAGAEAAGLPVTEDATLATAPVVKAKEVKVQRVTKSRAERMTQIAKAMAMFADKFGDTLPAQAKDVVDAAGGKASEWGLTQAIVRQTFSFMDAAGFTTDRYNGTHGDARRVGRILTPLGRAKLLGEEQSQQPVAEAPVEQLVVATIPVTVERAPAPEKDAPDAVATDKSTDKGETHKPFERAGTTACLDHVTDAELVIEMFKRGYIVSR